MTLRCWRVAPPGVGCLSLRTRPWASLPCALGSSLSALPMTATAAVDGVASRCTSSSSFPPPSSTSAVGSSTALARSYKQKGGAIQQSSKATVPAGNAAGGDSSASHAGDDASAARRASDRDRTGLSGAPRAAAGGYRIKVRRRDPWGVQQLRDSWSEDAMTKGETENMSERIHREYRYHPDEQYRATLKHTALMIVPLIVVSWALSYAYTTGQAPWNADPQHLLNLLRAADTSPRSKLYLYKLPESEVLPEHVLQYRAQHAGEREREEKIFNVTHSAFVRPTEDDLRKLAQLEEEGQP